VRASLILVAAVLLGSCFSPHYESGKTTCSPAGECPPGFQCSSGICYGFFGPPGTHNCIYDEDHYDDSACVYAP
jgi:hypothetical protein